MISLKEARKEVINIIGQDKVPAYSTLGDWINKGFISGVIEGTSRGAKYPDHIVYEIITAIKLKNEHNIKLKDIAKFRENAGLNKVRNLDKLYKKLTDYVNKLEKEQEKMSKKALLSVEDLSINELGKSLLEVKKIKLKLEFLKRYEKIFSKNVKVNKPVKPKENNIL